MFELFNEFFNYIISWGPGNDKIGQSNMLGICILEHPQKYGRTTAFHPPLFFCDLIFLGEVVESFFKIELPSFCFELVFTRMYRKFLCPSLVLWLAICIALCP